MRKGTCDVCVFLRFLKLPKLPNSFLAYETQGRPVGWMRVVGQVRQPLMRCVQGWHKGTKAFALLAWAPITACGPCTATGGTAARVGLMSSS